MELQQVAKSFIKAIKHLLIKCFIFFSTQALSLTQVGVFLTRDHSSSNTQEQQAEIMMPNPLVFSESLSQTLNISLTPPSPFLFFFFFFCF